MLAALRTVILAVTPANLVIEGKAASLVRESWPSGRRHELRFYLGSSVHG